MTESLPSVSKLASLPEDEAAVRTSKALYRAALGPVNAGHYLALFERFDANGRAGLVWNSAAGFFTPGWLVFRRLWAWAAGYLALVLVLLLLGRGMASQLGLWPTGVVVGLLVSLGLLLVVVPGLMGNAILHAHTRQRVERAKSGTPSLGDACIVLAEEAPSWNSLKAVLLGGGVAAVGLVAAVVLSPGSPAPPVSGAPATPPVAAPSPAPAVEQKSETLPVVPAPVASETAAAPVQPEPPAASAETAVASAARAKPAAEPVRKPSEAPPGPTPKPREPAAKPVAQKPKPKPSPPVEPGPSSYAINVGVFADAANVERVLKQLKAAKLPAYSQQIDGAKGPLTRVRVGPFSDGEQATAAAQRIRALGLDAVVFRP